MPFLRAFMIFMDFENNQIAFANKLHNFGAFITSDLNDDKGPKEVAIDDDGDHSFHHDKGASTE